MIYRFGDCALDTNLCTLQRGGQTFRLRLKVFRMCLYLLEHRDRVVSREELCAQVWPGQFVSQATLEGVIRLVRQAVGDSGRAQGIIQTLHGHGYRFVAPVEDAFPAGMPGETGGTLVLPGPVEVSILAEEAKAPSEDMDEWKPELGLDAELHASTQDAFFATNVPSTDGREPRAFDEQAHGRGRGQWWHRLPRLGVVLVLMALAAWGGWAVSQRFTALAKETLDKSRIAVLPFITLSSEAEPRHLADGLTEDVIAELAKIPGLSVIARTSTLKYKDSLKDVATIGHELQVGTIVEGSVRRIDNQIRVNVQLIDVASQGHLWSHEYDRELKEIFAIPSDIALRVAQWLTGQVIEGGISDCLRAARPSTAFLQEGSDSY